MKDITRRLNALEQREHGPQQVHVVHSHVDAGEQGEQAAIDAYGRDRIRDGDLVVVIHDFG